MGLISESKNKMSNKICSDMEGILVLEISGRTLVADLIPLIFLLINLYLICQEKAALLP